MPSKTAKAVDFTLKASRSVVGTAAIFGTYGMLGAAISFLLGREPGTMPENILVELAPSIAVIMFFLMYYEIGDVMAVGFAKRQTAGTFSDYKANATYDKYSVEPLPELVYLAQRVQTNQVEQMPVLIVGTLGCALYVNGTVAAILSLLWSLVRIQYAITYRGAAGLEYRHTMKAIVKYTIPAYFLANAMVMATLIHALRCLF